MLSNQITAYAKNGNSMDYMKYPVTMVKDLPLQNIDAMTNNEAMQQLMDLVDLKPYQIQRMLQKVSSDLRKMLYNLYKYQFMQLKLKIAQLKAVSIWIKNQTEFRLVSNHSEKV